MAIIGTSIGGRDVSGASLAAQVNRAVEGVQRNVDDLQDDVKYTRHLLKDHGSAIDSLTQDLSPADDVGQVSVIETGYTIDNSNYVDIAASYHAPSPLNSFGGVFLVVANYHGNSELVKVGEHNYRGAPGGGATFHVQLDRTFETVTFYFVSKNKAEATQDNWTTSPKTTVALNGSAFTNGLNLTAGGKNVLQNPGFESNNVGTPLDTNLSRTAGTPVSDGWYVNNVESYWDVVYETVAGLARTGIANLVLRLDPATSVPSDSTFHEARVYSALIPVQVGDVARISGWLRWSSNAALPAGVTTIERISLRLCNSSGAVQGELPLVDSTSATNIGWNFVQAAATIPATSSGQTVAFARFECAAFVKNASGSTFSPSGTLYIDYRYDDLKCVIQSTSFDISAVNTAYGANGGSPLTSTTGAGVNAATVSIAATTLQYGDGQISYSSGSITPLNDNVKYYIYADDPTFSGGAVAYQATVSQADVTGANGRVYFGSVTTPVHGGGGTGGGGGGTSPCVTGNTLVGVKGGWIPISDITAGTEVYTLNGIHPVKQVLTHAYSGEMCPMGNGELITPGHRVHVGGHASFADNWIPAGEVWDRRVLFEGTVYNLEVEEEHNYTLANGAVLHNYNKA